jgi:hypothetical protein
MTIVSSLSACRQGKKEAPIKAPHVSSDIDRISLLGYERHVIQIITLQLNESALHIPDLLTQDILPGEGINVIGSVA